MAKLGLLVTAIMLGSCSSMYYNTMEFFGQEKRDLLRSNLLELGEDQEEVKEEFEDVLSKIRSKYYSVDGDLEKSYDRLKGDYKELEDEVSDISDQVEKVSELAEDLFDEWEEEADDFKNKSYRTKSLKKLETTKKKFAKVKKSAVAVENKMQKSLFVYKEQVVFVKHNLNVSAIATLNTKLGSLETEMKDLIGDIENSIKESNELIKNL